MAAGLLHSSLLPHAIENIRPPMSGPTMKIVRKRFVAVRRT